MEMKNHVNVWFYVLKAVLISLLFVITACVSTPQVPPFRGEFIAGGRVKGLEYKSGKKQGITDGEGAFYFNEEDTVEFSLGGVKIGFEIKGIDAEKLYFSPFDLINDADTETETTKKNTIINVMRLLQSLDIDDNYENGIHITKEIREEMTGMSLSFNVSASVFETNADLVSLLNRLNASGIFNNRELKSYAEAKVDLIIGMIQDEDAKPPAVLINLGDDWVCGTQSGFDNVNQYTQVYGYAQQLASQLIAVFDIPWSNPLLLLEDTEGVAQERYDDESTPYNLGVPGATAETMIKDTTASGNTFLNLLFKPYTAANNFSQLTAAEELMKDHETSFINIFTITVGNNDMFRAVFNEGEDELSTTSNDITTYLTDYGTDAVEDNLDSIVEGLQNISDSSDSYIFISNLPDIDNLGALFNETDIENHAAFDDCDVTTLTSGSYLGFNAFMYLGEKNEDTGKINLLDSLSDNTQLNNGIASLDDAQILTSAEEDLVQDRIDAINAHIDTLVAGDSNVVLVNINQLFKDININVDGKYTITVTNADDTTTELDLTTRFGGGVFSLDGITPSHTGYAIVANEFIEKIQDTLKNDWSVTEEDIGLESIEIDDVYALDPYKDIDQDGYVDGFNLSNIIIPDTYYGLIDCNDDDKNVIAPFDSESTACL